MSSGACRALVASLAACVATFALLLPVAADNSSLLKETSSVTYTVNPDDPEPNIGVKIILSLEALGQPYQGGYKQDYGPIVVEQGATRAGIQVRSDAAQFKLSNKHGSEDVHAPWDAIWITNKNAISPASESATVISYTLTTGFGASGQALPVRIDPSYFYFCAVGQDTESGSVQINVTGGSEWQITPHPVGQLTKSGDTFASGPRKNPGPAAVFTCFEGTRTDQLQTRPMVAAGGRAFDLQAWSTPTNWLDAAENSAGRALDAIYEFLGYDIPGVDDVVLRMVAPRDVGGYASLHDTPGVVQLDEQVGGRVLGPDDPNTGLTHQLAHAWFGSDNFQDTWLREGMATWLSSSMNGQACAPATTANLAGVDLSGWQVIEARSPADIDQVIKDQEAAACGIVSAVAAKMGDDQWHEVLGSMLLGQPKYAGNGGPEVGSQQTLVDYREWLDAVDERGLVPAGVKDLDFAQGLLQAYGIANPKFEQRSQARQQYHEFLAQIAPMGAPWAVRKDMDNWNFTQAMASMDTSLKVFHDLEAANDALGGKADLLAIVRPDFEAAGNEDELNAVRDRANTLSKGAQDVVPLLGELQAAMPEGWTMPSAINQAIGNSQFSDIPRMVTPAIAAAQAISAADAALPQAGLFEQYRSQFEDAATVDELNTLNGAVAEVERVATRAGRQLSALEAAAGDWSIPVAVTASFASGQLQEGLAVVDDALAVVQAANQADAALPASGLAKLIRDRFEKVGTAAEMAGLRTQVETLRDEAVTVGGALDTIKRLAPTWTIPPAVSEPIDKGDFATAATTAAAAKQWLDLAHQADQSLDVLDALGGIQPDFEQAATLEQLKAGVERARLQADAADAVSQAITRSKESQGVLAQFGLWGEDVQSTVDAALQAAKDGNPDEALKKANSALTTLNGAEGAGSLRLAGIIFLGVAIIGVLGLWVMLRRQAGPPWARSTKPHWIEKDKKRGLLGSGKPRSDPKSKDKAKR